MVSLIFPVRVFFENQSSTMVYLWLLSWICIWSHGCILRTREHWWIIRSSVMVIWSSEREYWPEKKSCMRVVIDTSPPFPSPNREEWPSLCEHLHWWSNKEGYYSVEGNTIKLFCIFHQTNNAFVSIENRTKKSTPVREGIDLDILCVETVLEVSECFFDFFGFIFFGFFLFFMITGYHHGEFT